MQPLGVVRNRLWRLCGAREAYLAHVGGKLCRGHRRWLATPGRGGQLHNDTDMRRFKDPEEKYRDRWDLLGLD